MKPRIKRVAGFWRCVSPDAQGIGINPQSAYREYMRMWIDNMEEQVRRDKERQERVAWEHMAQMRSQWLQQQIATSKIWTRLIQK